MELFALSTLCSIVVLVFLLKLARLDRNRVHIPSVVDSDQVNWPSVSIVIPARNEEENIATSLGTLLTQDYPKDKLEIIVVDDFSTDNTRIIVEQLAKQSPFPVRCISGRSLPTGWLGKSNACMTGALTATGDYLYFIDADTKSEPAMLKSVIQFSESRAIDLLSFNPKQQLESRAEKAILPGVFLSIASYMNFRDSNDSSKEEAIANGQAMLFKRSAYEDVGGHSAVADQVSEDIAFAQVMKLTGHTIFWAFADQLMSTRMYTGLNTIWSGFSKNMNRIVGCRSLFDASTIFIKANIIAWSTPLLLVISSIAYLTDPSVINLWSVSITGITAVCLFVTYFMLAKELFVPIHYALFVPFGVSIQSALVLNSYRLSKNKQLMWKGRALT